MLITNEYYSNCRSFASVNTTTTKERYHKPEHFMITKRIYARYSYPLTQWFFPSGAGLL